MFGIKTEVLDFFYPYFERVGNRLIFNYSQSTTEYWTPERHCIPSTSDVWLAGAPFPNMVTELYISYSAADLMCFMSQRHHLFLGNQANAAFAALGLLPNIGQFRLLKSQFPNARYHLVFHADLLGSVADTLLAVWLNNLAVSFGLTEDRLIASYRNRKLFFDPYTFSLHRFELASGMRSGLRTHKPPRGILSFIDLQLTQLHDPRAV